MICGDVRIKRVSERMNHNVPTVFEKGWVG